MKKRVLAVILAAVMIIGLLPVGLTAYDRELLIFEESDEELLLYCVEPFNTVSRTITLNADVERVSNDGVVSGRINGFDFEAWTDARGVGPGSVMTIYTDGSFSSAWSETYNTLFRTGRRFPGRGTRIGDIGAISLRYEVTNFNSNRGATYLCVYGWTRETATYAQIEWYIVDNWRNWINAGANPPGSVDARYTHHGTVTANGHVYDIITGWRVNQPSLIGNVTFLQIFSVRRGSQLTGAAAGNNLSGTIDMSAHFAAWNSIGLLTHEPTNTRARWHDDLLLYEISFTVEGFGGVNGSSGTGNVTALCITYGTNRVCTGGSAGCSHCTGIATSSYGNVITATGVSPAWGWLNLAISEGNALPRINTFTGAAEGRLLRARTDAGATTWLYSDGNIRLRNVIDGGNASVMNQGVWFNPAIIPAGHEMVVTGRARLNTAATGAEISINHGGGGTAGYASFAVAGTAWSNFTMTVPAAWLNLVRVPQGDTGIRLQANTAAANAVVTTEITNITVRPSTVPTSIPVATWADALALPYLAPRSATVTAGENGLEISGRGTDEHDHNNGLFVDIAGLRALVDGSPTIVITGTAAGTTAGRFDMQGAGVSGSVTAANREFTITVPSTATIGAPWPGATGYPFLGTSAELANVNFTVTGITIGGTPLVAATAPPPPPPPPTPWTAVWESPYFSARSATVTPVLNGLEVTSRGTGEHDHNNGLVIDIAGLRAIYGGAPDIVITGNAIGASTGSMVMQGVGVGGDLSAGAFTVTIPGTAPLDPPDWGGVPHPFLGTSPSQHFDYIVTGITVAGVSIFDLLAGNFTPAPTGQTLAQAQTAAQGAIAALTVSNSTTAAEIFAAATGALTGSTPPITAAWQVPFNLTPATTAASGTISGTIRLTQGTNFLDVTVNRIIAQLEDTTPPPFPTPANLTLPQNHTAIWPYAAGDNFTSLSWWGVGSTATDMQGEMISVYGNPEAAWRTGIDVVIRYMALQENDTVQIAVAVPTDGVTTGIEIAQNVGEPWTPETPDVEIWVSMPGGANVAVQPGGTHIFTVIVPSGFDPASGVLRIRRDSAAGLGMDFYITGMLASRPPVAPPPPPPPPPPAPPAFSQTAGFFRDPFNLSLTAETGATIRFTTDGSIPTRNSQSFTAPIFIYSPEPTEANNPMSMTAITHVPWNVYPQNRHTPFTPNLYYNAMVIRARTFDESTPYCQGSEVITHSFFVDRYVAGYGTRRFGDAQVVSITVEPEHFAHPRYGFYRNWDRNNDWPYLDGMRQLVNVEMFYPGGEFMFSQGAMAWVSGQSSRERPKKSMRFNFNQGGGSDVTNMPGLIPNTMRNFEDPTTPVDRFRHFTARQSDPYSSTIRDSLVNLIAEPLRPTIQNATYGAIFVNGEFWGMSCLRTHRNHSLFAAHFGIPRGLIEMNTDFDGQHWGNAYEIARLLRTYGFAGFQDYVCLDDLIDYIIIGYHFSNWDWITNNFEFWRTTEIIPGVFGGDGRWRFVVQDFDITMGRGDFRHTQGGPLGSITHATNMLTDFTTFDYNSDWRRQQWAIDFINGLFAQDEFVHTFAARYSTYTGTVFHPARQNAIIDSMVAERAPYVPRDYYRWRGSVSGVDWWNTSVNQLRTFLNNRAPLSLQHISEHMGITTSRALITWRTDSTMGFFDINGAQIRPNLFERFGEHGFSACEFTAQYILGLPITVTAVPLPGYFFTGFTIPPGLPYEVLAHNKIRITPGGLAPLDVVANFSPPVIHPPYVLINQLYAGGDTGNNAVSHSFVELFNPTDYPIYLGNYSLQIQSPPDLGSNTTVPPQQVEWDVVPLEGYIYADSSFLIVSTYGTSTLANHRVIQNWDMETGYNFANRGISVALVEGNEPLPILLANHDRLVDLVGALNTAPPRDRVDNYFTAPTRVSRSQGARRINPHQNVRNNAEEFIPIRYAEISDADWRHYRPRYSGDGPRHAERICTICIGPCRLGDVNGDGRFTSLDATWLARRIINPAFPICTYAANFFGNGEITSQSVVLLARWLVGHNVELDQRNQS
ncbi:MAG: glycoside hydrolase family 11 protein [Defluviitaleaceae bacterium]|nr:glycoside hydrolase family 11 protein [Defluviitaleaceae bacterium]MCL2263057.1 glycoside hydrolase family 11 protein [Defluviitaleaceae bacterium]